MIPVEAPIAKNFSEESEEPLKKEEPVISLQAIVKTLDFVENSEKTPITESKFAHLFENEESKSSEVKAENLK